MDLFVPLNRASAQPLRDQLYTGLRAAILDGRLPFGARLPAARVFAKSLGVSRFTIDDAYSRLVSDGYVTGRHGSGTFIAYDASETSAPLAKPVVAAGEPATTRPWSRWALRLPIARAPEPATIRYSFRQGLPALDPFPLAVWRRCQARVTQELRADLRFYGDVHGYAPLRSAIAAYLARARLLRCAPEEIVITSGTQQAIDLTARLLIDPGDRVALEEPGYPTARRAFLAAGAELVPFPVDADGLLVQQLLERAPPKLVYVTPSHQFPTGGVLPLTRRRALLDDARRRGYLIVEDDYDSEFRYGQRPVEALAALDRALSGAGAVLYIGTFSKVLYPSLRLGYLIAPPDMVERMLAAKDVTDRHPSTLEQATLAEFIAGGFFERHLARMRRVYAARLTAINDALALSFGDSVIRDPATTAAGLHLLAQFDVPYDEVEMVRRARARGILIDPAGPCYLTPPARAGAMLGYAVMTEPEITAGIAELANALLGDGR